MNSDPGSAQPHRVIVGVDGSAQSAAALAWAAADARLRGWDLVVVTAYSQDAPRPGRGAEPDTAAARELACHKIQARMLRGLPAEAAPPVSTQALPGDPVRALVSVARAGDVLVVGTTGQSRLRSLLLGSVPQGCAERAACPVVVVPSAPRASTASRGGQAPVVVGIDRSAEARAALRFAAGEAMLRAAELVPVHAVYPDYTTDQANSAVDLSSDEALLPPLDSALAQLSMLVRADLAGLNVAAAPISVRGDPATVLLRWTQSAALVVLGAHGAGRLHAALLGSVTTHLLRYGRCPVAVIPAAAVGQL